MKNMNTKKITTLIVLAAALVALPACNDFLDEMPDNRTELDSSDKITSLLVSAYSEHTYPVTCEYASDNVDETALVSPDFEPEQDEYYRWQDVTAAVTNEAPQAVWSQYYMAIAAANQALDAIKELGGADTPQLKAAKGEALICRAYAHFCLANMFCQAYNPQYASEDLGIPYMEKAETILDPKYTRGTLAEVYSKIDADLIEGLPLITDEFYSVPKYHFNQKAAYAFAARFYLFYQKWDECIAAAKVVLGSAPETMMRDLEANGKLGLQSADGQTLLRTMDYIDYSHKCNLLLQTSITDAPGISFGPYNAYTGFSHGNWLDQTETFRAPTAPWGSSYTLYSAPYSMNTGKADKCFAWRAPYLFEIKDPVMQTGLAHTVFPAFTAEETLLCRAEAYIMKKEYGPALNDMNLWISKYVKSGAQTLTEANVNQWAQNTKEYTPANPTVKKPFGETAFPLEAGTQTNMCYALLHLRRVETVHLGLRWFDIKRYGITIYRRKLASYNTLGSVTDELHARDPRCAMQLPMDVVAAGLTPNPR